MDTLTIKKRDELGKRVKALRASGNIPAVVYGPKQESISIVVALKEFENVLKKAGESSVISLDGLEKPIPVLIHKITHDPITSVPEHIDFYAIEKGAKVVVSVPVVFIGESPVVKAGANLVKVLHEIEIEADAMHLMHEISVDISKIINIGDSIHVGDISLGDGVTLITEPKEVIVIAQEVIEEKEPEEVDAPDISDIEVEKKGKKEEDSTDSAAK